MPEESKPEATPDPKAVHLEAMRIRGSRLCPVCNGIGLVRKNPGKPRVECERCYGFGSLPCPEGEREVFMGEAEAKEENGEVVAAGWLRRPARRCYEFWLPTDDHPLAIVTEAEIDHCQSVEEMRALAAAKLGR